MDLDLRNFSSSLRAIVQILALGALRMPELFLIAKARKVFLARVAARVA